MKIFILIISSIFLPIHLSGEIRINDLIDYHREIFKSRFGTYLDKSDILSDNQILNFKFNPREDTIYIKSYSSHGGYEGTHVWNEKEHIKIYPDQVKILPNSNKLYRQFYSNWDTDVLKHLGNEYHYSNVTSETYHEYLTRIIIENGNIITDTTTYLDFDSSYLEKCTQEQLDSIREIVHLINNTQLIATSYPIKTDTINNHRKIINQPHKELSLWQRIADWFRRLWKAIFG